MKDVFSARRLEQEVDGVITAALNVGRGGFVQLSHHDVVRTFVVDRIVCDEAGYPAEIWMSGEAVTGFFTRFLDRLRGVRRRDLIRVSHSGGDVRRSMTTVEVSANGVTHIGFREELGAPRISRSVATFRYPTGAASDWLQNYRRAG